LEKKFRIVAIIVIIMAVAAYPAYVEAGILTRAQPPPCPTCNIQQPVLDVIIPKLLSSNVNSNLNVTEGNVTTLEVDIYSAAQMPLNVSMRFFIDGIPGGSSTVVAPITATFGPEQLAVQASGKAVTHVTLSVSHNARLGIYSTAVSAIDNTNSSWIWGVLLIINVTS
jgi:hypothetical protein